MTKSILTLITLLTINITLFSQDVITKKTGEDIQSKVLEVTQLEVKYKEYNNQDGPIYTISKAEILMIRYENGTKNVFNQTENVESNTKQTSNMRIRGKRDSEMNYKGKKSGAGWTAATTIALSPVFGVIPAAACAASEPSNENLNYPDGKLMEDFDYNRAYVDQSHKTKKKKIWTSYGISSGVWLLLTLLL